MTQEKKLIKIEDLYSKDDLQIAEKRSQLAVLLNQEPKKEWLSDHPFATKKIEGQKVPVKYIPIQRVEFLLTAIFLEWNVEIKSTMIIANSVVVTVRLYVKDPLTENTLWNDGIGAAVIQTESGAPATDFTKVLTDAVMKAAPAAESYAVKDAAEKFGKIFGKDINRDGQTDYSILEDRYSTKTRIQKLEDELTEILDTYQDTDGDKIRNIVAETKRAGKLTEEYLESQIQNLRQ